MSDTLSIILLVVAAVLIVVLLVAAGCFTYKLVKNGKIAELRAAIEEAILEAEKTHASGAAKKEMVIKAITAYCQKIGLPVDEKLLKWAADYIDAYIAKHNNLKAVEATKIEEQKIESAPVKKSKGKKKTEGK